MHRLSRFTPPFGGLSLSSGQVPCLYSLVCRCRLTATARLACIRHAANVNPEPGSNSPSWAHLLSNSLRNPERAALRRVEGSCSIIFELLYWVWFSSLPCEIICRANSSKAGFHRVNTNQKYSLKKNCLLNPSTHPSINSGFAQGPSDKRTYHYLVVKERQHPPPAEWNF